ncbi:MAG: amino acid permease [Proteobacteria bacterium]|nr:amino acid permease [Pseudomonadota bacterium]
MLGSGVFVLPGLASGIAGPWVSLSFLLAGFMVLPAVLSKAELATAMPVAGGTYVYIDRAMGPWIGTITGIGTWGSLVSKTAFVLAGLGAYLTLFADASLVKPVSLAVLVGLVTINVLGVGKATKVQNAIVALCLAALTGFGLMGFVSRDPTVFAEDPLPAGKIGIVLGAAFVFNAYAGVTKICSVAEEIHHPAKNIPRGMIAAHLTGMTVYAIIAWIIVANVDPAQLATSATPVTDAAANIGGRPFVVFMAVISVLGLISMSNAGVMSSSRYPFAMGRDWLLPSWTNSLHPRFGTPMPAILITGVALFLLVFFLPVVKLAKLASGFKIVIFTLVNVAVIVLRETQVRWYKPKFRSPLYPWVQILGIIGGVALLSAVGTFALSGVLAVVVAGTLWYFIYVRSRVDRKSAFAHVWGEAHVLAETQHLEEDEELGLQPPRVITPLFGWERDPERLMRLGTVMVDDGWLEVMRLEELPTQTMLVSSIEEDDAMKALSDSAYAIGVKANVKVAFHDLLTHNAKRATHDHAAKTRAEWMVMSWPEKSRRAIVVRNPMAWWMDHAPCDLAVLKDRGEPAYKRVLVLAKPGPYDSLVVHVADRIATASRGSITLLRLVAEQAEQMQIDGFRAYHRELSELCRSKTDSVVERTADTNAAIARLTADYDLLVLGAARESSVRSMLFGSPEDAMASAADCSVLMVKAPRHAVHSRFEPPGQSAAPFGGLGMFTTWAACGARVEVKTKDDLLVKMARRHAEVLGVDMADSILSKLHKREQQQPTALSGGVALIGATKNGIPATSLGIFTSRRPLNWVLRGGSRGIDKVDVALVVLSPPDDRRTQLWMLGRLARMVHARGFLRDLRAATTDSELLAAVRVADEGLDDFLDRMDTSTDWAPVRLPDDSDSDLIEKL